MRIRNSAKAVIIQDSKVLLTKNKDEEGFFYLFPGGGQEHGEALMETVKRECIEEIGEDVEVKDLLHVREYIGKNHEHADYDNDLHQVEYYFVCTILEDQNPPLIPSNPDTYQVGIEWLPLQNLMDHRIYPRGIRKSIQALGDDNRTSPVYLGDIN